jgi:hypothetical protein
MKNFGLKFDKIEQDHYFLGGGFIGTEEIQPDGQWDEFLPPEEIQNTNEVETMACTIFGTINCLEILFNKMFHEEKDFAERFNGILANISETGGSPHTAGESIRKFGLVDQILLPFDETIKSWDDFYSPKPMTQHFLRKGQEFLKHFEIKHEWVFTGGTKEEKVKLIKEALKRSPVGISVFAWSCDDEGIYQQVAQPNHWGCCYGWNNHGWKIFDSYTNSYKLYSFDADIAMAKLYWLKKRPVNKEYWFVDLFKRLFSFIIDICGIS